MHEAGYCHGVLHAVEDRAAGRPVARIGVRVGSLHRIVPAAFEQSFQLMAAGGVADGRRDRGHRRARDRQLRVLRARLRDAGPADRPARTAAASTCGRAAATS